MDGSIDDYKPLLCRQIGHNITVCNQLVNNWLVLASTRYAAAVRALKLSA